MHKRAAYAVMRCLSVRPHVCLSRSCCAKTSKHILQLFSLSGRLYGNIPTAIFCHLAVFAWSSITISPRCVLASALFPKAQFLAVSLSCILPHRHLLRSLPIVTTRSTRPHRLSPFLKHRLDPHWKSLIAYYRATRMHSADYTIARCPSVRRRYCIEISK